MKIEMSTGTVTNTMNGITRVQPTSSEGFILNWEEGKNQTSIALRGGKNYTFMPKEDPTDTVFKVVEYSHDQKVKEWEIDVSKVDAHHASYIEMFVLSIYTDDNGYTKDFHYRIDAPLSSVNGLGIGEEYADERIDYYEALKASMEADRREGFYQHYLSIKSFFDYYDKKEKGVPSRLL